MRDQLPPVAGLKADLRRFLSAVSAVWRDYQNAGPGRVDAERFAPVQTAWLAVTEKMEAARDDATTASLRAQIDQLKNLAQRCACHPQGLCFITGEAGLIPRRDLYEAFQTGLQSLGFLCDDTAG